MSKITLQDIADDTGFSASTVSRVLNGSDKISGATRDKVLKSAKAHNYHISTVNNTSPSTRTLNVALVATGFHEGEFYVSFFNGLNKAARQNNIRLFLSGVSDEEEKVFDLMKEVTSSHFDAAIIYVPEFDRKRYDRLYRLIPTSFPIVSNALIENPVFSTITFDSYSGGHLAAVHFEGN